MALEQFSTASDGLGNLPPIIRGEFIAFEIISQAMTVAFGIRGWTQTGAPIFRA